jgi:hypothetical protein
VEGRVVDTAGQPVVGARVELLGSRLPPTVEPSGELGVLHGPIPFPPLQPSPAGTGTFTDATGRFRLEVPTGTVVLAALHPQFLTKTAEVAGDWTQLVLLAAPVAPELPEAPGAPPAEAGNQRLAGMVVDDRGFPIAGARVEAAGRSALSDAAGRFELTGLPPGPYRVRGSHADFAPAEVAAVEAGEDARLQLVPGGGVEGELRDSRNGQVPPGAVLELSADGQRRVLPLRDGRFVATGVRAGRVVLLAHAPGYVPLHKDVEVPAGDRPHDVTAREVRLELEPGGVLTGRVRGDNGDGVPGAQITAGAANGRTDSRGEFRLDGVAAGRVRVAASESGRRAAEEVDVRAGEESRVELTLSQPQ